MTILLQCDKCWCRFATKHKKCPKCGNKVPTMRKRFVAEVRDLEGKKHVKTLGEVTLEEARSSELELKKQVRSEKVDVLTVELVCKAYIAKMNNLKRVYASDVEHRLGRICVHFGKLTDATSLDTSHIDSFRGLLIKEGLNKSTVDRYFAAGRAAWNYSVDGSNPWKRAGMFNPDNKITRFLSPQESSRLLEACSQISRHLYEIVFVALGTGLRKSEILQLSRSQVDFKDHSISVIAKGGKRRLLYPAQSVMRLLQDIPDNETQYFWVGKDNKPYSKFWKYSWNKALKHAGLPLEFRFHDLRHHVATLAYAKSKDIYAVQQLLGHTNITTTMRYAHLEKDRLQKLFGTIDPSGE